MADPNPTADGVAGTEADPNAPEFSLQSVYLKDCSFEAPKGPRVEGQWNPNINLELDTATEILSPDLREIVLRISVTAKNGDATAFLVEVQQGGILPYAISAKKTIAVQSPASARTYSSRTHARRSRT